MECHVNVHLFERERDPSGPFPIILKRKLCGMDDGIVELRVEWRKRKAIK